jgi:ATP-dependent Zn proteases
VLLFGFWIFLMNQVQGGGSKVMSFGKSRAKRMTPDSPKIGFKDVAGVTRRSRSSGDQGVPREPEEVPGARRAHPEGRPALRAARHR